MAPVQSARPPGTAQMSRRTLAKIGAGLVVVAGLPLLTQQSIGGQQGTPTVVATPFDAPSASPQASPAIAEGVEIGFTMDLRFEPERITIAPGTAVTWTNTSPMPHTATGDPDQNPVDAINPEYVSLPDGAEPWGSELLQPGDSYTHVFEIPGEYTYICIPHVMAGMRGTITVR